MGNVEFRKLGGAGKSRGSINLPPWFLDRLKWKSGEMIIVECDDSRQQLVLRKVKDR